MKDLRTLTVEDFLDGQVLLVDKPLGFTSFQAVNALKWALLRRFKLKKIKIGHAGTLDPLASGLLIICTGKFTKRIQEFQGLQKTYTGTFTLGSTIKFLPVISATLVMTAWISSPNGLGDRCS